jgi:CheY-like chemotaxis protein
VLERPELLKDDSLASEIGSRQRYDWRVQADLPPNDPQIRRAVRELAQKIATAIERTSGPLPAIAARGDDAAAETSKLVKSLGPEREAKNPRKLILWVDDRPNNNILERHSMAAYNIDFVLAQSTGQALAELRKQQFDAIISDMGRPPDLRAGYTLLEAVRGSERYEAVGIRLPISSTLDQGSLRMCAKRAGAALRAPQIWATNCFKCCWKP